MKDDLTLVLVDDEPLALRRLRAVLGEVSGVRVVGEASTCADAVELITVRRPDVALLDIRLRDGTGFDILERLPHAETPSVIFTTAFDHFAVRAFEVSAADYILKPIEPARLAAALEGLRERLRVRTRAEEAGRLRAALDELRAKMQEPVQPAYESEIWVRSATGNLTRVAIDQINWVASEEDYVRLHTDSASYLVRLSIRGFEARVDPDQFVRAHRSTLVRRGAVREIRPAPGGRRILVLEDGSRIVAGRVYARQLRARLGAQAAG